MSILFVKINFDFKINVKSNAKSVIDFEIGLVLQSILKRWWS